MSASATTDLAPHLEEHDPPGLGRAIGISCAILCPFVFVDSLVLLLAQDVELGSSIGFALFVTMSAGFGFAAMLGGAIYGSGIEEGPRT